MRQKIDSINNPKIKHIIKLKDKKYREKFNMFIVEGEHLVKEAVAAKMKIDIYEYSPNQKFLYKSSTEVSKEIIKAVTEVVTPQNIFGVVKYNPRDWEVNINLDELKNIAYLEKVQDPGNIGTIIRLCRSFDIDLLVVQNFDIYNPKVIRASQGSFFKQRMINVKDYNFLEKVVKSKQFNILATTLKSDSIQLNDINFGNRNLIIFGNEGNGISEDIEKYVEKFIYIPISFESLNVATAAAIVLNKVRNG
ncbi:RNA methyltransferase [Mycoplasmopsis anatis]|uniref:tRNA/rRNA methylase n=1 Tax=Mycoplasmopsis anatis 1340 TaxID=1034808 RepID=F9QCZ1_9BACT|nr:RNA methyltransferase [Mycoplasmopsis anatis]AWX70484.1 RNA methyltransferase [Mycoplasmopsis anatis]EGS29373.1 tRNA/rRNA methylase [Mycoplasmopsis anatis 1340]VEU73852.1 tRNA/rRNA methyltransferase [Mycoplasmopsis anatis]